MNQLQNPQCTICAELNRHVAMNSRDRPISSFKSCSVSNKVPSLYSFDMTQRPSQDNYITYCNISNNMAGDSEPHYVQVVESDTPSGRIQYCVSANNDLLLHSNQNNAQIRLLLDRQESNCGMVLCTCKDFLSSNIHNKIIYEALHRRDLIRPSNNNTNPIAVAPQVNVNRDSIDSHLVKSIDDQPENSIYSNASVLSDPMCRFCHLSKNTQSDQLISPCYCCGTLKYVHQSCLKTWLEVSKKQRENSVNQPPHCELCNFKYIRKRKFQFGKLRQPKLSHNDCALHLIFLCSLLVMVTSASVTILCFAMEKSGSKGNREPFSDKSSDSSAKFPDRKSADISKSGNILCEYFSNINLKDYRNYQRHSASKVSVICDLMLKKIRKSNGVSRDSSNVSPASESQIEGPRTVSTVTSALWNKDYYRKMYPDGGGDGRMWVLSPEEAVTLASGVIFFMAFFVAMMVQVKSSYTCYQLVRHWIRLNYTNEVQNLRQSPKKSTCNIELQLTGKGSNGKAPSVTPREYVERCITEI